MLQQPIHSKVGAGAVGGAIAVCVVFIETQCGLSIPTEVAAAQATLFGFALGWLVKP